MSWIIIPEHYEMRNLGTGGGGREVEGCVSGIFLSPVLLNGTGADNRGASSETQEEIKKHFSDT